MKSVKSLFFIVCLGWVFLLCFQESYAQTKKSRAQLEKEKADVQKRLSEFDKILKQTSARKKNSLGELQLVSKQLETRVSYINTLNREVTLIDNEIKETESKIVSLENDLKNLKEEYGNMIYVSYKLNSGVTIMTFIFSSSTFKQFYMRLRYLKQYSDARKKQVAEIERVNLALEDQRALLEDRREEKHLVLQQEQLQKQQLDQLKNEQQGIIQTLSQKEEELKKEIAATKKQQEQLNKLITMVIEEEIRLAEADAKKSNTKTTTTAPGSKIPLTPEGAALSSSFAGNKGRIPWPVASGFISRKYGTHAHPTLRGITETNDGVDIQTNSDETVRSVFSGTVTKITTVPGMGGTVIIRHGEYYTMYSRLKTITVKSGQQVNSITPIGTVYTNKDGIAEVHFQTWKGLEVMDPSVWLSRK
ncbi:MAG TPA: peptidoglycan DD-metalloendopeptidase family protein [Cyclobacteriaceae bacterium]|nr:peptidoglycan DD-metalloendopeptidase family protein [Cyclobacteriaceae bacterium]